MQARPVPNALVSWNASAGTVESPTSKTNGSGVAETRWTLGSTIGEQTAVAPVAGLTPVSFRATAASGPAAAVEVVTGDRQSGAAGMPLPLP